MRENIALGVLTIVLLGVLALRIEQSRKARKGAGKDKAEPPDSTLI